jgi:uncharacterized protein GlcG (DUF336 family)
MRAPLLIASFLLGAQTSALPQAPPVGGPSLALAWEAANTAIATCNSGQQKVAAIIVDENAQIKVAAVADGASSAVLDVARRKAVTSLTYRMDGLPLTDLIAKDETLSRQVVADPQNLFVRPRGARLIMKGTNIIGVVAVSGAIGHDPGTVTDDDCARAGLQKIAAKLR